MAIQLILTCEHAGNRVPVRYRALFHNADEALQSHRGWDPGALAIAKSFVRQLAAPLFCSTVTRLLVEPNRTLGHRRLFSGFTAGLDKRTKQAILKQYYHPHRNRVESWIADQVERSRTVVHLSLHTFTPQLDGQTRNADVGLLYDPRRPLEKILCNDWRSTLKETRPDLRIRRNYPYLGKADGFTSYLRRRFMGRYAGIELEVNQLWLKKSEAKWRRLKRDLARSFAAVWNRAKRRRFD